MKTTTLALLLLSLLLPSAAFATPNAKAHSKTAPAPALYRCSVCQMTYSAADAKKDGYKDPMDGGKLVPVTPAPATQKKS